jgi:hypothetical protein
VIVATASDANRDVATTIGAEPPIDPYNRRAVGTTGPLL